MCFFFSFFCFNDTAPTEIYTLSLHDALPICTANSMMDPTMLAVIGIVLTLGATMLQMVKGG